MRNLTKMTLANRGREDSMRGNYEPESRRDSRGRYAPKYEMENAYGAYNTMPERQRPAGNYESSYRMKGDGGWVVKPIEDNYGPENRRDRMGRYAPRNESAESRMPPYWENRMEESRYRMDDDGGRMIGFDGGMESRMRMGREHHEDTDRMQMGGSEGEEGHHKLDKRTAMEWVNRMENSDKSRGEHFTMEQTERVRKNKGWECDPVEFWVAMNATWSDGAQTARKFGVDKLEYWAERAKEFLDDEDAVPDKMAKYYKYIVKKG